MFNEMNENQVTAQENVQPDMTQESTRPQMANEEKNPYLATEQTQMPPVQKEPGKKYAIVIAIVIAAVVLAVVIVAFIVFRISTNKKTEIAKAMKATFSESEDYLKGVWKTDEYERMFEGDEYSVDADFSLPEGISLEMTCDSQKEKQSIYMDIAMAGSTLVEVEGYADESKILIAIPNMLDYVFAVHLDTIEEDIRVMVENGMLDEYIADELVKALNTADTDGVSDEALKQFGKDLLEAWDDFYDSVEVEETDEKKLSVNGEKQSCKGYIITVTGEQFANLMEDVIDVLEENEEMKEVLVDAVSANGMDYEDEMDVLRDELEDMRDSEEKLNIEIYLCNGILAQIYCENDAEEFAFTWNVEGGNFPLENTNMKVGSDGDGYIEFIRTGTMEDGEYHAKYEVIDEYETGYVTDIYYDTEDGSVSLEFLEDEWSYIYVAGSIEKTNASTIEIEIDAVEYEEEEIFSGDMTISNKCGEVAEPEGEEKNVLTMTEDEWYEVIMEALESMQK